MQIHDAGMIRGVVCILYFVAVVCFEIFDLFVCDEERYYHSACQSTKDLFHTGCAPSISEEKSTKHSLQYCTSTLLKVLVGVTKKPYSSSSCLVLLADPFDSLD